MSAEKRRVERVVRRYRALLLVTLAASAETKVALDKVIVAIPAMRKRELIECEEWHERETEKLVRLVGLLCDVDDFVELVDKASMSAEETFYIPKYFIDRHWFASFENRIPAWRDLPPHAR